MATIQRKIPRYFHWLFQGNNISLDFFFFFLISFYQPELALSALTKSNASLKKASRKVLLHQKSLNSWFA